MIQRDDSESRENFGERATTSRTSRGDTRLTPTLSTAEERRNRGVSIFQHAQAEKPEIFARDFGREQKKKNKKSADVRRVMDGWQGTTRAQGANRGSALNNFEAPSLFALRLIYERSARIRANICQRF